MSRLSKGNCAIPYTTQQGAALLIFMTLIILVAVSALLGKLNHTPPDIIRSSKDTGVLAEAKTALLGYAVSSMPPGQLPCPDYDNDGLADTCTGAGPIAIGRLPWRDLRLTELRDSHGEKVWYVPAREFESTQLVNSGVVGGLSVDTVNGIAAVLIAPGESLQGQNRAAGAQNIASRYLEDDNNNNDVSYVTSATGDFNDQLTSITDNELLESTGKRVAREIARELRNYYADNGFFPYAASPNDTSGACDDGVSSGLVPVNIGAVPASGASCSEPDWGTGPTATLPAWFANSGWHRHLWYEVAPACVPAQPGCSGVGLITVTNSTPSNNIQAIVVAAGVPLTGQTREPVATDDSDFMESVENTDDDTDFEQLAETASNNDHFIVVAP